MEKAICLPKNRVILEDHEDVIIMEITVCEKIIGLVKLIDI
jgi:hypothetical protein